MKIVHSDLKKGEVKVKVENSDDSLALNNVINEGDFVSGHCERKVKIGRGENAKAVKKSYFLKIFVEKVDFNGTELRINGKTVEEKEDIPKGSYQTIEVFPGTEIKIEKEKWNAYHLKKLKDSTFASKRVVLIVILDRESAIFAKTKKEGFDVLLELEGDVQKKAYETKKESKFFQQIIDKIREYSERYKVTNVIVASPAFWKDDLLKLVKDKKMRDMIISLGCGSVSENAIYEVLKSSATKKILEQEMSAKEVGLVEEVTREISKGGPVAYGLQEVSSAVEAGNVRVLLFTDSFFTEKREAGEGNKVENLLETAEQAGAEIHIISAGHDGGRTLNGLGGIASLLRYKSYS